MTSSEPAWSRVRGQQEEPATKPRAEPRTTRARQRPTARDSASDQRSLSQLPEVSPPIVVGADHESRPTPDVAPLRSEPPSPLFALMCNLAAALFGLGAALVARRLRASTPATVSASVLHLPSPEAGVREVSRAA